VKKLDKSLALGRATYERWLGTEPDEITAAADALRQVEPNHRSLVNLEVRLRRARQKGMLRTGGGCDDVGDCPQVHPRAVR